MSMKSRAILVCAILALCLGASTVASAEAISNGTLSLDVALRSGAGQRVV